MVQWKDRYELRLTGLQTADTQPRTILDNEDIEYIAPSDWTPDGESVLLRVFRKDRSAQIGLVSVKERSLRVLKTTDWGSALGLFLSPDGRYIGMDLTLDDSKRNERDVFVLAVDGSREIPVVVHPGRDIMMGWSPDGRHLLFSSDRSGAPGLWSVAISDGRPTGAPVLVKSDIAPASLGVNRPARCLWSRPGRSGRSGRRNRSGGRKSAGYAHERRSKLCWTQYPADLVRRRKASGVHLRSRWKRTQSCHCHSHARDR